MLWTFVVAATLAVASSVNSSALEADIRQWVTQKGYPFEPHNATTTDDITLRMFRLPRPGAPAVLMMHGILDSAWAWVFNQEFKALAFTLHDVGYDVWLGNNRGNGFSTSWANGSDAQASTEFWSFSFDDMARTGLPAMIQTVLDVTKQPKLAYVAHSQGTTQFLIAGSEPGLRDWMAARVSVALALSPIAWMGNSRSILLSSLAELPVQRLVGPLFPHGFLQADGWREAAHLLCKATLGAACKVSVDFICGSGPLDHAGTITEFVKLFPFGTSLKDIVHFSQSITHGQFFRRFDHGTAKNLEIYRQATPPEYNVSNLAVPTAFFVGSNDLLADTMDVDRLLDKVTNAGKVAFVGRYKGFSHITWTLGSREASYYVADVLKVLKEHHLTQTAGTGAWSEAAVTYV